MLVMPIHILFCSDLCCTSVIFSNITCPLLAFPHQTLFVQALQLKDGIRPPGGAVDPEVVQAIHRLIHMTDDFEKMGLSRRSISKYADLCYPAFSTIVTHIYPCLLWPVSLCILNFHYCQHFEDDLLLTLLHYLKAIKAKGSLQVYFLGFREEVNKAYRRLAALVHPDKCKAAGAEEAFKTLTQARNNLLKILTETTV